jgi:hypothetical protein
MKHFEKVKKKCTQVALLNKYEALTVATYIKECTKVYIRRCTLFKRVATSNVLNINNLTTYVTFPAMSGTI